MKRIPLALFATICFSSCSLEYNMPTSPPVGRTREIIWEEPKVTRVHVNPVIRVQQPIIRTTRVVYNTTPVVRTYNYTPPIVYKNYRYNYSRNCAPVIRTNRSTVLRSSRHRAVSRYCPQRGWHFVRF
jgi:hypothetical protein